MYPGFIPHWKRSRCGESRESRVWVGAESGRRFRRAGWEFRASDEEDASSPFSSGVGSFGVRRPLRFLAYKLGLEDAQVAELARILDEIKTERAQAAVDHRRAISTFAEAIEADTFDETKANAGASIRVQSADRLRAAVVTALGRLHRILDAEQRARLAYLIRTGTLSI
jgi:Spy/CpxP family protein refolding chaperone